MIFWPDEILAEAVRRRYQPQFPQSWDADFISKAGAFKEGKVVSSVLVDLYANARRCLHEGRAPARRRWPTIGA